MPNTNTSIAMVDGGKILALGSLLSGTYMYVRAQAFSSEVARFPQLVAAILIVGSLLILAENYLPKPVRILIQDNSDEDDELKAFDQPPESEPSGRTTVDFFSYEVDKSVFAFSSCVYYVLLSYMIGIFNATPIFVMTYMYMTNKSWKTVIGFGVLGFVIAYLFTALLNVQLMNGVLVT